jgi:hypothetical protein
MEYILTIIVLAFFVVTFFLVLLTGIIFNMFLYRLYKYPSIHLRYPYIWRFGPRFLGSFAYIDITPPLIRLAFSSKSRLNKLFNGWFSYNHILETKDRELIQTTKIFRKFLIFSWRLSGFLIFSFLLIPLGYILFLLLRDLLFRGGF